MTNFPRRWCAPFYLLAVSFFTLPGAWAEEALSGVVNVYSARHYDTDLRLYEAFT